MYPLPTLYYHPVATTCRPIMMFADEHGLAFNYRLVDLFSGENNGPAFTRLNPNQCVPLLVEDDFRLSESSAILKFLADRCGSPAYPADLKQRAQVNALMDWFNTGLMRDLAYGVIYPQVMPHHRRPDAQAQRSHLDWSRARAERWLQVLDRSMLADGRPFLTGDQMSLADYFALGVMTLPRVLGDDLARWPQVRRWLAGLQVRPGYRRTHAAFDQFVAAARAPADAPSHALAA